MVNQQCSPGQLNSQETASSKQSRITLITFQVLCGATLLHGKEKFWRLWIGGKPWIFIHKPEAVEVILNSNTILKKTFMYDFLNYWFKEGLITSSGSKWHMRRKLLTPAFHFRILSDFQPVLDEQSRVLVKVLEENEGEEMDIVHPVTLCTLDIICETAMGIKVEAQRKNTKYVEALKHLTGSTFERMQSPWYWNDFLFKISPFGRKYFKNVDIVHGFTRQVISEKKEELMKKKSAEAPVDTGNEIEGTKRKKMALMDLLLDEHFKNSSISEEEIREEVDTFTFEGHDTTSSGISWCLWMIGLHPWVQDKIQEELDSIFGEDNRDATMEDLKDMKYLECVIKESLRLYPPVPAIGRMLRNDLQIGEYVLPKGSVCLILTYLLHRDPEFFPNPEKFDPDRFTPENSVGRHPFAYVPFSAGPRNCIGQRFALMEEKTIISSILRKYKIRSLDPRDKIQLLDEIVLRPHKALRIQIRERKQPFDFNSIYYYP
ncbi:unnamed protein product [Larinioides sclopetarius]|uniref:Cytochrome P450 n=1 Tax=Larinioides sclopetarius TaxID=280406 RepID=A0AAV2A680_9ARAC